MAGSADRPARAGAAALAGVVDEMDDELARAIVLGPDGQLERSVADQLGRLGSHRDELRDQRPMLRHAVAEIEPLRQPRQIDRLPFAEAATDVDKPSDHVLVEGILKRRNAIG